MRVSLFPFDLGAFLFFYFSPENGGLPRFGMPEISFCLTSVSALNSSCALLKNILLPSGAIIIITRHVYCFWGIMMSVDKSEIYIAGMPW